MTPPSPHSEDGHRSVDRQRSSARARAEPLRSRSTSAQTLTLTRTLTARLTTGRRAGRPSSGQGASAEPACPSWVGPRSRQSTSEGVPHVRRAHHATTSGGCQTGCVLLMWRAVASCSPGGASRTPAGTRSRTFAPEHCAPHDRRCRARPASPLPLTSRTPSGGRPSFPPAGYSWNGRSHAAVPDMKERPAPSGRVRAKQSASST